MVSLMTLHAAKGLEFDTVFLPGWEEGLFPHQRALDESGARGSRRSAASPMSASRAPSAAHLISFAANRRVHNQWQSAIPSRFIDELPPEHVEVLSAPGLYGGGWRRGVAPGGGVSARETEFAPEAAERFSGWRDDRRVPGAATGGRSAEEARASFQSARKRALTRPERPRDAPEGIVVSTDPAIARFKSGDRVFHDKFGYGTVRVAEGDKLTIKFDHSDEKKVVASFVRRG